MEDSILDTIKSMLGPDGDYDDFDKDLIVFINNALSTLTQFGIGPPEGFKISDAFAVWSDFIPEDRFDLESVKTYIYMKVKLIFDPPTNASVLEAFKEQIKETEWRLNVAVESTLS